MAQIYKPWTQDQCNALNAYQKAGRMHPFTCGSGNRTDPDKTIITQTTTCNDGTKQTYTITISAGGTDRVCNDGIAAIRPWGCKLDV